jgi:hypothetical protein
MPASQIVLNGQVGLMSAADMLALGGSMFSVNTPSPGTGVAYAQLTAFSATANGLFVISNNNSVASQKNIILDRLSLFQTAAVATGTAISFEVYNETGIVAGTTAVATRTPVQINTGAGFSQSTGAVVQAFSAGAITIPAAVGTRRLQGQAWIPVGVNVVKDNYVLDFGVDGPVQPRTGLTAARATDTARCTGSMNPIIIAPQTTSWINMWGLGTSTPSFEYNLTYIEL